MRDSPTRSQYAALRRLRPAHVRVDLHAGQDPATQLERAVAVGEELRCRVEVAAFVDPGDVEAGTDALVAALAPAGHRIDRVIVLAETTGFSAFRGACPPRVAATVRSSLAAHGMAEVPIVTGTDQFFVDINRDRPDYTGLDGLVFAANPQVHACDDRSIMQNAQPIVDVVEFARRLYPSLDIVISPLDLLGANGPYPAGPPVDGGAPANEDRRLRTGFGAAWTCAALGAAARARVGSVTLFELAGPRGLVDDEPFPVLSLLTSLADQQDSPMLAVQVDDPDRVATLAFQTAAGPVLYVANLTGAPLTVVLPTGDELDVPGYAVAFTSEGGTSRIA